MGKAFGKANPDATISILDGTKVASDTPGAVTVLDPNRGLTDSQLFNRKLVKVGGQFASSLNQPRTTQGGQPVQFTFAQNQPSFSDYAPPVMKSPFFGSY